MAINAATAWSWWSRGELAVGSVSEVLDRTAERPAQLADLPGAEDEKSDDQNDDKVTGFERAHRLSVRRRPRYGHAELRDRVGNIRRLRDKRIRAQIAASIATARDRTRGRVETEQERWTRRLIEVEAREQGAELRRILPHVGTSIRPAIGLRVQPLAAEEQIFDELAPPGRRGGAAR